MGQTLLQKVWDRHTVRTLSTGQTQLFIGLHLIHEVTSPQAFDMLRAARRQGGLSRAHLRHRRPHRPDARPAAAVSRRAGRRNDDGARAQLPRVRHSALRPRQRHQGIVHVIGPELGLTQPGMTIACGDSHTSTHGAFGAIAFGIGTVAGARRARVAVPGDGAAESPAHHRERIAAAGRLREGRDPAHHPPARRERRRRLRLRIRRRRLRSHDDGRAHDRVQHVDRGRGARRLRESGRDHVQVHRRTAVRAEGRRVCQGPEMVGIARVRSRRRSTTTSC